MDSAALWDRPSPRVAELIRSAAEQLLTAPETIADEVDAATIYGRDNAVAQDPVLAAAVQRTNRANVVHWATANVRDPGAPVAPNLGYETVAVARDLVRRGLDQTSLHSYRLGQNVAWRHAMNVAFSLTSDPEELRELLDVMSRSIFTFVDETLMALTAQMEQERDVLTRGTHAERLEAVSLILEGAPIARERAEARLGYALERTHTAAIIWTDADQPDPGILERAADALARTAAARPLTVVASASALWVWVPGADGPDLDAFRPALEALGDVRVAVGPTLAGLEGFRRSHLDALATQRLLHRIPSRPPLASYDDVQVVALATHDEDAAEDFVDRVLGELAAADAELRETLRTYLAHECNATRTARVLFTHRNTVLGRLARAERLLPAPLEGRLLPVALALEILRWRG